MIYNNLLNSIGNTPLVKLNKFTQNPRVNLYAKLEGQNPSGSIKDRAALFMIEQAEKRGQLKPGMTILEATSGNMGIALAMVAAQKGYKVKILMSEGMSEERRTVMRAYGAELILTDKALGTGGAIAKARELTKQSPEKYWFSNQFNNPDNTEAHYYTAEEILEDLPEGIDALVAGTGTSGTIMGFSKKFRESSPDTRIIGVIPPSGYQIQGLQNPEGDFHGDIFDNGAIDERISVEKEDAYKMARRLAREEGVFVGMSSGAALAAGLSVAKNLDRGNIVVIFPDRGEKYLSTGLFS